MRWRGQISGQRAGLLGLIGIAIVLSLPLLSSMLVSDTSLALAPVYVLAYLFAIIVLPLMLYVLLKFAYSVFARPYLRLWRMRRFRNNRYLMEAVKRNL